ncbi:MAG TPA: addiction module protein [Pirellulaceae bacterium]|jgi:putative addiction module component (TIGR02574 family)
MDVLSIMKEVGNWPVEDRLRLIEEVWDTLSDRKGGMVLSESHTQDLQRRLDAYRDHPQTGAPWDEVKSRLRGKTE